jgi:hypothetical protein
VGVLVGMVRHFRDTSATQKGLTHCTALVLTRDTAAEMAVAPEYTGDDLNMKIMLDGRTLQVSCTLRGYTWMIRTKKHTKTAA